MKPGARLKSAVCDAEVIVVRGSGDDLALACGGSPMVAERPAAPGAIDPAFAGGLAMGKRYVDAEGSVEFLCVKPGKGSLSIAGVVLQTKEAKPLPSSD